MSTLSTLKKNSTANLNRLSEELDKIKNPQKNFTKDNEGFYRPAIDAAGNGYAVIRFLPAPKVDGEDALPWVRIFKHSFKGPTGKWYIEKSLTTLNQKDPVSELNSQLWNTGNEADKNIARAQKRKLEYVSRIEVVEDPKNPENEGKEFFFRYGKKIMDMISEKMNPQFKDEEPLNPFDFWNGADFKLKIRTIGQFLNYDKSEFSSKCQHRAGEDKALEKILENLPSLKEFVSPDKFKTYDVLKARLDLVLRTNEIKASIYDDPPFDPDPPKRKAIEAGPSDELAKFQTLADED